MTSGFSGIGQGPQSPLDVAWLTWIATLNPQLRSSLNIPMRRAFDAGYHSRDAEVSALKRQLDAERRGNAR